jgi:transposase
MRGDDQQLQTGMFSYVALEDRIPTDHPLRGVRALVDAVLAEMSKDFDGLYSQVGRPSIAPERLLRALLLQVFYSVRSERLLMEQLNYNLLFRWFVGLEIDDAVWSHAVFSKNRDRLLNQDLAQKFFAHVKEQAAGLMSDEHFTVDGTLIEAWAGQKSFRRKDNGGSGSGGDFHGESRRNQTHASRTDPDSRLYKKSTGQESKLSYLRHTLVENRKRSGRITTGADKAYDTRDFVDTVRELGVTPHVARRQHGAIDERTSRHLGYGISLSKRWLVEKPFGWLKQIGSLKKVKLRGLAKVDWLFVFSCAVFNLIRIPKLRAQST